MLYLSYWNQYKTKFLKINLQVDYHGIVTHTGKLTADHYLKCLENGEPRENHMSVKILLDQPPNHQQPQPLDHQVAGNFNP